MLGLGATGPWAVLESKATGHYGRPIFCANCASWEVVRLIHRNITKLQKKSRHTKGVK